MEPGAALPRAEVQAEVPGGPPGHATLSGARPGLTSRPWVTKGSRQSQRESPRVRSGWATLGPRTRPCALWVGVGVGPGLQSPLSVEAGVLLPAAQARSAGL